MSEQIPPEQESGGDIGSMRSPIRPTRPDDDAAASPPEQQPAESSNTDEHAPMSLDEIDDPKQALEILRRKTISAANEFSEGKLNPAQFNAIYSRYGEQRQIIQLLLESDPENDAWRRVAAPGHTTFLRDHYSARLLYYIVFKHLEYQPLAMGGDEQPDMAIVQSVLSYLWKPGQTPKMGMARKKLEDDRWLFMASGEFAVTLATFQREPSRGKAVLVRDLHADFERANGGTFKSNHYSPNKLVFPQRSLEE